MKERLNKYIAQKYKIGRRVADRLIQDNKVFVDGKKAELGQQVDNESKIEVKGLKEEAPVYFAYYKPLGVVTTLPQEGEKAIADITDLPQNIHPVGRLDKASDGLLIMTNDGSITEKLLHPTREHEKEYLVEVDKEITHQFLVQMRNGVKIGAVGGARNYKTKPTQIRRVSKKVFEIILKEGKNRQIRRMAGGLGYKVTDLQRFRIENIELGVLKPNTYRKLKGKELKDFLEKLN